MFIIFPLNDHITNGGQIQGLSPHFKTYCGYRELSLIHSDTPIKHLSRELKNGK
jgi:hypothetical protein